MAIPLRPLRLLAILIIAAALVGCDGDEPVRTYQAPKDPAPRGLGLMAADPGPSRQPATSPSPTSAPAPSATTGSPAVQGPLGVTWSIPSGWTAQPEKPMRLATFAAGADASQAEVVITRFPANSGSLLDNINRWRGQAGVDPITDAAQQEKQSITIDGHDGAVYDFASPQRRIRVAMIPVGDQAWFFKLQGTAEGVAKQTEKFDQFVASVKFGEPR